MAKNPTKQELVALGLTEEQAEKVVALQVPQGHERGLTFRVNKTPRKQPDGSMKDPSGSVSVIGLNSRFPTTLYKSQWKRLLAVAKELDAFLDAPENQEGMSQDKNKE